MLIRIVALVLGLVIAAGVVVVALEARYQSCVAEAEARNPVYVEVDQRPGEVTGGWWRDEPERAPGAVESSVEGLQERQRAVDDC